MSNKLLIFGSTEKIGGIFGRKRSYLKRIKGYNTGKEGGERRDSLAKMY